MRHKVFLVDDSVVNRNFLKAIFVEHNYEVIEASRGGEAMEMIETIVPDLMILDLIMPGIGGFETLKGIRAKGFTFPIIIFTSDDKDEIKRKCLDAGANDFLYKPSKPGQILRLVEKMLSSSPTS